MTGAVDHDVIVAGDGPAAAAVAFEGRRRGLDVAVIGPTVTWSATYAMWRDEVPDLPDSCFVHTTDWTTVRARTDRTFPRRYGVVDNAALRRHLQLDDVHRHGRVQRHDDDGVGVAAHLDDGDVITGRWLVDATGRTDDDVWQTAYGVVVNADVVERAGYSTDAATVMGWLPDASPPCFVYSVPVEHGWLVEVTSLAARPAVDPQRLRRVLIDVVGEAAVVAAEALGRHESVRIPMGPRRLPEPGACVVPFGTAGGMGHPSTGYSLAASLAAAGPLAAAMSSGTDPIAAVWDASARRTRSLHDGALDVLLRIDGDALIDFFEAFYSIPPELWADYLRIGAPHRRTAAAMRAVFRAAPWSVRRRLLRLDGRVLAGLLRSSL